VSEFLAQHRRAGSEVGLAFFAAEKQISSSNSSPWWSDETLADAFRQRQAAEEPTDMRFVEGPNRFI
jgi:hypothetical protein